MLMSAIRILLQKCSCNLPMYGSMFTKWNVDEVFNGALLNWGLIRPIHCPYFGIIIMIAVSLLKEAEA